MIWHCLSVEMVDNAVHKWSELATIRHTMPVAGGERICHDEAVLGTRHGYIELAGVFLILPFSGVTLVRIAFGSGIVDDDIVEFQALCLVYGGNVDPFFNASAVAKVAFFHRIDFYNVTVQLFDKYIGRVPVCQ